METLGDISGLCELVSEPEGAIFVAIAGLCFVAVMMTAMIVLGGVVAVAQEAIFGGGPPSGLGLR